MCISSANKNEYQVILLPHYLVHRTDQPMLEKKKRKSNLNHNFARIVTIEQQKPKNESKIFPSEFFFSASNAIKYCVCERFFIGK